ncbi:phosphatase PAP2 family protein [Streptomyces sp. NBC_00101]|uniref:phosphatase PAP2 family protein n=1 Tax=Streptomyces sp. NBC_00101 TaxID=2975651 RepID=UPI003868D156
MMHTRRTPAEREPDASTRPPLVREFLLVVGLFLVYKLGRQAANGHVDEAFRNAGHVWDLERAAGLPGEGHVQGLLMHGQVLIHLANTYYATVHFPATVLFLVWLFWRHPHHYLWSRRILAALTGAALVLHLVFPLAPPRMLAAAGLVDTGQVYGPSVYGATPTTDTMANQFAAMPSLHFGWALMVAVGLVAAGRSRWRWLWLLHPLLTLLVIVGTANHYWLDALVVMALLALALAAIPLNRPSHAVRLRGPWPSAAGGFPGPGVLAPAGSYPFAGDHAYAGGIPAPAHPGGTSAPTCADGGSAPRRTLVAPGAGRGVAR